MWDAHVEGRQLSLPDTVRTGRLIVSFGASALRPGPTGPAGIRPGRSRSRIAGPDLSDGIIIVKIASRAIEGAAQFLPGAVDAVEQLVERLLTRFLDFRQPFAQIVPAPAQIVQASLRLLAGFGATGLRLLFPAVQQAVPFIDLLLQPLGVLVAFARHGHSYVLLEESVTYSFWMSIQCAWNTRADSVHIPAC